MENTGKKWLINKQRSFNRINRGTWAKKDGWSCSQKWGEWYGRTHSMTSNCAYNLLYLRNSNLPLQNVPYLDRSLLFFSLSIYIFFPFLCSWLPILRAVSNFCVHFKDGSFFSLMFFPFQIWCLFLLIVIWNILMSVSKGFTVIPQSALLEQMCSQYFQWCTELPSEHVLPFWKELYAVTENITASKWITSQSLRGIRLQGILENRRRY